MGRYAVVFQLSDFGETDWFPDDVAALVEALAHINANFLEQHPNFPPLYRSGVRYRQRAEPREIWRNAPGVLRQGFGRCHELTAWRLAELSVRERIDAEPYIEWTERRGGNVDMHILLQYPTGQLEDPSRVVGMKPHRAA